MKKRLSISIASLLLLSSQAFSQKVTLAKVSLGMSGAEIRQVLSPSSPHYIDLASTVAGVRYVVAETADESFSFTFIEDHVAAFSLMHVLPAGQQVFLKPGQEPSVKVLRDLVIAQTWAPARIESGDTFWASDAAGAPLSDASLCTPKSSAAWQPTGTIPGASAKTTAGLMRPSLVPYPQNCGVSIHLNATPAKTDEDRVTAVRIQVLDIHALNRFVSTHPQH